MYGLLGVMAVCTAAALISRWFFQSPMADALAEQMRQNGRRRKHWKGLGGEWIDVPADGVADEQRAAELEDRLSALSGQVSELAERLDFAERLLAEKRSSKLGAGR
jgi:hypothetical protein